MIPWQETLNPKPAPMNIFKGSFQGLGFVSKKHVAGAQGFRGWGRKF